jgi:hypothetical protein
MAMIERIRNFYAAYCAIGDRLGEAFYAVWMVVVSTGLLNSVGQITREHILYVVVVSVVVNLGWGIIDGVTVMYGNIIERVQRDRIIHDLRTGAGDRATAKALADLDDTVLTVLPEAERRGIVAAVADGPPGADPRRTPYRPSREDWLTAVGIIGIDVFMVIPVLAPIVLVPDTATGVYISRLVATAIFAAIGAAYARNLNHRRWPAALGLGILGFTLFTAAFAAGW